jgi:hypothetical protein
MLWLPLREVGYITRTSGTPCRLQIFQSREAKSVLGHLFLLPYLWSKVIHSLLDCVDNSLLLKPGQGRPSLLLNNPIYEIW